MLPQIKKKFVSAALGLAIFIPTVAVFTGAAPVKIGAINNQEPVSAASAWWGDYWWVNQATANTMSYRIRQGNSAAVLGIAGVSTIFPPAWASGVVVASNENTASTLDYCSSKNGGVYFKVYSSRIWVNGYGNVKVPYFIGASCN